ncbi:hypothetical protein GCM10020219_083040 [Nonomuraea dietziae]
MSPATYTWRGAGLDGEPETLQVLVGGQARGAGDGVSGDRYEHGVVLVDVVDGLEVAGVHGRDESCGGTVGVAGEDHVRLRSVMTVHDKMIISFPYSPRA